MGERFANQFLLEKSIASRMSSGSQRVKSPARTDRNTDQISEACLPILRLQWCAMEPARESVHESN